MENEVLMQKEIEAQRRLPVEIKKVIRQKSFNNMITAITIMVYFLITNILFFLIPQEAFLVVVKIFAGISAIVTIAAFEIGYRKKNDSLFLNGFEFLIFSIILLYLPYIYIYKDTVAKTFLMLTSVFFAIYYVIKTVVVYIKTDIKHKNSLSDIKDILKPEVRSYIEEESKKTIKARKEAQKNINTKKVNDIPKKTQKEINDEKVAQIEKTLEKMRKFNERRNLEIKKEAKVEEPKKKKVATTKMSTTKKKTNTTKTKKEAIEKTKTTVKTSKTTTSTAKKKKSEPKKEI